ncbi:50S ribosomal protein L19, chloroplastic-like [Chenopodium quinoa]|uniref:50S ribosomal protein L19, chloroplastic-like n=1 Tax=Chenopodium quinoa TaxID=63459 RepID=UPI000B772F93|nr:50S ribosomal protein L19, chloroplastic-like [Chenopodium quinoa]
MASKVLPQALFAIPSNHSLQCPPLKKQLGFPFESNRRFSLSYSRGNLTVSRDSSNLFSSNFSSIFSSPARNSFVVRSEAEGSSDASAESEAAVAEEEAEAEAETEAEAEARSPWKPRVKMGDIMGILNKRAVEASDELRPVPDIRTGDIVQIKLEVPENKRRLSVYKGIVISRQNAGIHTTIRTRRIVAGIGVEIVFPLYSPNIKEIKVVAHRKVRKARLYYLRDKLPRLSTFK